MYNNICYIVRSLKPAGAEKYVLDLASHLSRRCKNVYVVSLGVVDEYFLKKFDLKNVTIYQLSLHKLLALNTIKVMYLLYRFIIKKKITFIHLNMRMADITGGIIALLLKRKFISTQHDTQPWRYSRALKNVIYKYIHRFLMRYSLAIIAPSKSVKQYLFETEKIPYTKMKLIYHGIDLDKFSCKLKDLKRKIKIGSLARFFPEKGHKYIVEALPIVLSNLKNKDIELQFAGVGPIQPEIEAMAEQLRVINNIKFLGRIYDVPKFLSEIDILVHAAVSSEAFCYAALEGLATGKSVIVTNIDGLPEFIKDHYNGILIPIKSPQAIATALIELITHPAIHMHISKNAALSCRPFFSTKRMVNETYQLYKNILKNG
jgi:glycosyltransferase involved in cell wall biosynthesis